MIPSTDSRAGEYLHFDVFASQPLTGNGLIVFPEAYGISGSRMQALTSEMRQFESIFLSPVADGRVKARIFTVEEELVFAGHPLLGAAAALHLLEGESGIREWRMEVPAGEVQVSSARTDAESFRCRMIQENPRFGRILEGTDRHEAARRFGLDGDDLDPSLPVQVVSTGLPYLLIPIRRKLATAALRGGEFEEWLAGFGAKFAYLYDPARGEGRTWDNAGLVEDVATGSAAGPVAAWLCEHGRGAPGEERIIRQGDYAGRPGRISTLVQGARGSIRAVEVSGEVQLVGQGRLASSLASLFTSTVPDPADN